MTLGGAPNVEEEEVRSFAFAVGKAVQNYGTLEYLINEVIAKLVKDPLVASTFTQLGVAKRIDILQSLVARRESHLQSQGWRSGELFHNLKAAFRQRNKIAHNPYVVSEDRQSGKVTVGIHVIRYHEKGTTEEWVTPSRLEQLTLESNELLTPLNRLLGLCYVA
jgi:hypothetical protein